MKKDIFKPIYIALIPLLVLFIFSLIPISTVLAADQITVLSDSETGQQGWVKSSDGIWHFYTNGVMATGWKTVGGKWYLFNDSGDMLTGWQKSGSTWYYLKSSGAMVTDWQKINGTWYYFRSSGAMVTGWQRIGGTWYYFKSSGAMVTGWQKISDTWYYFKSSGAMVTGWQKINGTWYYFKSSGAMAADEWVTGYWLLDDDGAWSYPARGSWHRDSKGWWFGDTTGWYAKNETVRINGVDYTFNDEGYWGHYEEKVLRDAWDENGYFTIRYYCTHCGQSLDDVPMKERYDHERMHADEIGCWHTTFLGFDILWISETLNKEYSLINDMEGYYDIAVSDEIKDIERDTLDGICHWEWRNKDEHYIVINGTSIQASYFTGAECFCGQLWGLTGRIPAFDLGNYDDMIEHQDETITNSDYDGYECMGWCSTYPYIIPEDPSITTIHHDAVSKQVWVYDK